MNTANNNIIMEYFDAFSNKDIERLKEIYHENVYLIDWIANIEGKELVINANQLLFKQFPNLKIQIEEIIKDDNGNNACQIKIFLEENNTIDVCDIIKVINGKIFSIHAYKC
jgi:ketosteroid isomerase-like protein